MKMSRVRLLVPLLAVVFVFGCSSVDNSLAPDAFLKDAQKKMETAKSGKFDVAMHIKGGMQEVNDTVPEQVDLTYSMKGGYDIHNKKDPIVGVSMDVSGEMDSLKQLGIEGKQGLGTFDMQLSGGTIYGMVKDMPLFDQLAKSPQAADPKNPKLQDAIQKMMPVIKGIFMGTWVQYRLPEDVQTGITSFLTNMTDPSAPLEAATTPMGKVIVALKKFKNQSELYFQQKVVRLDDNVVNGVSSAHLQLTQSIASDDVAKIIPSYVEFKDSLMQIFPVEGDVTTAAMDEAALAAFLKDYNVTIDYWVSLKDHSVVKMGFAMPVRGVQDAVGTMQNIDMSMDVSFFDVGKPYSVVIPPVSQTIDLNKMLQSANR